MNESVALQGDRYRILNTSSMATLSKDTFLNRLVVQQTRREDSGMYVCLAANKMGYSFRRAYVTVEQPAAPVLESQGIYISYHKPCSAFLFVIKSFYWLHSVWMKFYEDVA
jgi:hypothetical protein